MRANDGDRLLGAVGDTSLTDAEVESARSRLASLPMDDLRSGWRCVQTTPYLDSTPASVAIDDYFDALGAGDPQRAVDFIAYMIRDEPDDELVALIGSGKLLGQLLHFNGAGVIDRLERMAAEYQRDFAELLLGVWYHGIDEAVMAKLRQVAPILDAWRAD